MNGAQRLGFAERGQCGAHQRTRFQPQQGHHVVAGQQRFLRALGSFELADHPDQGLELVRFVGVCAGASGCRPVRALQLEEVGEERLVLEDPAPKRGPAGGGRQPHVAADELGHALFDLAGKPQPADDALGDPGPDLVVEEKTVISAPFVPLTDQGFGDVVEEHGQPQREIALREAPPQVGEGLEGMPPDIEVVVAVLGHAYAGGELGQVNGQEAALSQGLKAEGRPGMHQDRGQLIPDPLPGWPAAEPETLGVRLNPSPSSGFGAETVGDPEPDAPQRAEIVGLEVFPANRAQGFADQIGSRRPDSKDHPPLVHGQGVHGVVATQKIRREAGWGEGREVDDPGVGHQAHKAFLKFEDMTPERFPQPFGFGARIRHREVEVFGFLPEPEIADRAPDEPPFPRPNPWPCVQLPQGAHGPIIVKSVKIIGLTGPIGGGKSTVAAVLAEAGVPVIDADRLAHEALEVRSDEICRAFPEACTAGTPDRSQLARIVFQSPERRARLEGIIHPYVQKRIDELLDRYRAQGAGVVVVEIPLLFEKGWERRLDGVLVVNAPWQVRRRRLLARGLDPEDAERREASQMPAEEKVRRATWVIDNSGGLEALKEKTLAWLREVL